VPYGWRASKTDFRPSFLGCSCKPKSDRPKHALLLSKSLFYGDAKILTSKNEKRPVSGPPFFASSSMDPTVNLLGLGWGFHFLLLDFLGLLDEIVSLLQQGCALVRRSGFVCLAAQE
jgi:hypothetical protein